MIKINTLNKRLEFNDKEIPSFPSYSVRYGTQNKLRNKYTYETRSNACLAKPKDSLQITCSLVPSKLFSSRHQSQLAFPWLTLVDKNTGQHIGDAWVLVQACRPMFLKSNSHGTIYVPSTYPFARRERRVWIYHPNYGFVFQKLTLVKQDFPKIWPLTRIDEKQLIGNRLHSLEQKRQPLGYKFSSSWWISNLVSNDFFGYLRPQKIQGWIIDSQTGKRLPYAKVIVKRHQQHVIYSDKSGHFSVYHSIALASSFFFTIQKEQYLTKHFEWSKQQQNSFLLPLTSIRSISSFCT